MNTNPLLCFHSCKGFSVHINDKCHVTGLLGDPLRFGIDLGFSKDKIQVFLKTRYSLMKISGVAVCIVGVVMVVFSDVHAGDRAGIDAN